MAERILVEVFGIRIDSACAALLNVALNGQNWVEREKAIEKLGELSCNLALGIVAEKGQNWVEREKALSEIKR